ncbi:MAG TPA: DUF4232 domain-containing protein [Mycobacteriales bacterium]|nr:DUF4232 domain-containing protein [Mycobacteriales bacterium]
MLLAPVVSASPVGLPTCSAKQLAFRYGNVYGGMNHAGYRLILRNAGAACSLGGYPVVVGTFTAFKWQTMSASQTPRGYLGGAGKAATVRVARGASISTLFEGIGASVDPYNMSCQPYDTLTITLPGDAGSLTKQWPSREYWLCDASVHPLTAGTTGGAYTPDDKEPVASDPWPWPTVAP